MKKKVLPSKPGCACAISTAVIHSEVMRKKHMHKLRAIHHSLKQTTDKKNRALLLKKRKQHAASLHHTTRRKARMKKLFHSHTGLSRRHKR